MPPPPFFLPFDDHSDFSWGGDIGSPRPPGYPNPALRPKKKRKKGKGSSPLAYLRRYGSSAIMLVKAGRCGTYRVFRVQDSEHIPVLALAPTLWATVEPSTAVKNAKFPMPVQRSLADDAVGVSSSANFSCRCVVNGDRAPCLCSRSWGQQR
jgi:hypothetical protein